MKICLRRMAFEPKCMDSEAGVMSFQKDSDAESWPQRGAVLSGNDAQITGFGGLCGIACGWQRKKFRTGLQTPSGGAN